MSENVEYIFRGSIPREIAWNFWPEAPQVQHLPKVIVLVFAAEICLILSTTTKTDKISILGYYRQNWHPHYLRYNRNAEDDVYRTLYMKIPQTRVMRISL